MSYKIIYKDYGGKSSSYFPNKSMLLSPLACKPMFSEPDKLYSTKTYREPERPVNARVEALYLQQQFSFMMEETE